MVHQTRTNGLTLREIKCANHAKPSLKSPKSSVIRPWTTGCQINGFYRLAASRRLLATSLSQEVLAGTRARRIRRIPCTRFWTDPSTSREIFPYTHRTWTISNQNDVFICLRRQLQAGWCRTWSCLAMLLNSVCSGNTKRNNSRTSTGPKQFSLRPSKTTQTTRRRKVTFWLTSSHANLEPSTQMSNSNTSSASYRDSNPMKPSKQKNAKHSSWSTLTSLFGP